MTSQIKPAYSFVFVDARCWALVRSQIPNGAAGHYLMGMIQKRQSKRSLAVEHFEQALALDPFLWWVRLAPMNLEALVDDLAAFCVSGVVSTVCRLLAATWTLRVCAVDLLCAN